MTTTTRATSEPRIQLMRIAGRAVHRLVADMADGAFQRVDEGERNRRSRFGQIVPDRIVYVTPRRLAKNGRLAAYRRPG